MEGRGGRREREEGRGGKRGRRGEREREDEVEKRGRGKERYIRYHPYRLANAFVTSHDLFTTNWLCD